MTLLEAYNQPYTNSVIQILTTFAQYDISPNVDIGNQSAKYCAIQFSAKIFNTFYTSVKPLIAEKYSSKVQVIFRQQIQPWHPSSTLVHEAGAAVLKVAPEKFWEFSQALFKEQRDYFDEKVVNEVRNDTYKRLAALAATVGVDEKKVYDLLVIKEAGEGANKGNGVTNDIKLIVKVCFFLLIHIDTVMSRGYPINMSPRQIASLVCMSLLLSSST